MHDPSGRFGGYFYEDPPEAESSPEPVMIVDTPRAHEEPQGLEQPPVAVPNTQTPWPLPTDTCGWCGTETPWNYEHRCRVVGMYI
ncbi:hypothetical protein GCM10009584_14410 [Ornithinimicrobium humiphilum]